MPRSCACTNPAATSAPSRELDAETLEVVEKFEAAFSELVPPAPAPSSAHDPARLDVDFMDEELRKAFGDDESLHESSTCGAIHHPFDSVESSAARPVPRVDKEQNLSFEDAMATLRASETRGRANVVNIERPEEGKPSPRIEREAQRHKPESPQGAAQGSPKISLSEPLAANESWTTRSRKVWPKVAGAAALALCVGTAVGYLAGKTPSVGASRASIATTPEGGSKLRFDYELTKR